MNLATGYFMVCKAYVVSISNLPSYLSTYLAFLIVCLSLYIFIYLFIYLSVYLSSFSRGYFIVCIYWQYIKNAFEKRTCNKKAFEKNVKLKIITFLWVYPKSIDQVS